MSWEETYRSRVTSAEEAVKAIRSRQHVWIHAGCNNPEELVRAMVARADELEDVTVSHLLTFGCADHVQPRHARSFRHRALFTGGNVREAVNDGRADFVFQRRLRRRCRGRRLRRRCRGRRRGRSRTRRRLREQQPQRQRGVRPGRHW